MEKTCKAIFLIIGRLARFQLCDPHRTHQMCINCARTTPTGPKQAHRTNFAAGVIACAL